MVLEKRELGSRGEGDGENPAVTSPRCCHRLCHCCQPQTQRWLQLPPAALLLGVTSNHCNRADVSVRTVMERFVFSPSTGTKCVILAPLLTLFQTAELVSLDTIYLTVLWPQKCQNPDEVTPFPLC